MISVENRGEINTQFDLVTHDCTMDNFTYFVFIVTNLRVFQQFNELLLCTVQLTSNLTLTSCCLQFLSNDSVKT